jgi:hypothetical protein
MKKLLLLSAVTLGTVVASHAGVNVHLGIGIPFPIPGSIIIGQAAPPPIVYQAPVVLPPPAPVVVAPQPYYPPVVSVPAQCAPPVVIAPSAPIVEVFSARRPQHVVYANGRGYYGHQWEYVHHHR